LETSRTDFVAAYAKGDDVEVAAIEAEWRTRLWRFLRSDPTLAEELRRLLRPPGPAPVGSVYNVNRGDVRFGSVIQAGQISGAAFHATRAPDEPVGKRENEE
jgi:hypothetical protein